MFDQQNGKVIYLEGTYTKTFSSNDYPTPGYDYNQMMYRLDLSQPELNLPQPVYHINSTDRDNYYWQVGTLANDAEAKLIFFALDRPQSGTQAVKLGSTTIHVNISASNDDKCLTIPLWRWETQKGMIWQVGDIDDTQNTKLVGHVWPVPSHVVP